MEEIIAVVIYAVLEIFGEILLQIFGEILAEFGVRSVAAVFQKQASPWLASVGYAIIGTIVGCLSVLVVNRPLISKPELRVAYLALNPVLMGFVAQLRGNILNRKGKPTIRLNTFAYGALFGATYGLARFYLLYTNGHLPG